MAHSSWDVAIGAGIPRPPSAMTSPRARSRSRAQSISSDRPSTSGYSLMAPPVVVSPAAAFIAASAASQIVTNDHDNHANQWYDQYGMEPSGETAVVTDAALQLVNNFLDQLLFGFLSLARSASLSALRPAVTEVLKPKLAKDAISQADEELREYLGGGDDEDMLTSPSSAAACAANDWDLELVWKRTRLRCMVYSSLGDMEEEDEDFYMEQENLGGSSSNNGDDILGETVSPAVAIFLTSILEFMGEQALTSAGQAAFQRTRFLQDRGRATASAASETTATTNPIHVADRIVVDEVDMERVAFDRTVGRLWRAWKKRIRIASPPDVHALSPRSPLDIVHSSRRRVSADDVGASMRSPASASARQRTSSPAKQVPESSETAVATASAATADTAATATATSSATASATASPTTTAPASPKRADDWLAAAAATPLPEHAADVADILFPVGEGDDRPSRPQSVFVSSSLAPTHRRRASSLPGVQQYSTLSEGGGDDDGVPSVTEDPPSHHDLHDTHDVDSDDDFGADEEAQIMTSARVPLAGLSCSSPTASEHSFVVAIVPGIPTRSSSIRSQRVIDVSSAASRRHSGVPPGIHSGVRSRNESPEMMNPSNSNSRMSSTSRSISSQRIAEESSESEPGPAQSAVQSVPIVQAVQAAPTVQPVTTAPVMTTVTMRTSSPIQVPYSSFHKVAPAAPTTKPPSPVTFFHDDVPEPPPRARPTEARPVEVRPTDTRTAETRPVETRPIEPVPERSAKCLAPEAQAQALAASTAAASGITTTVSRPPATRSDAPPSPSLLTNRSSGGSSSGRAQLQVQSADTTSQSSSGHKLTPKRSSDSLAVMRPEDVARNFEQLIHSDETIQYTLTPEGMRDMESSGRSIHDGGSSSSVVKGRKSEDVKSVAPSRSSSLNHGHNNNNNSHQNRLERKRSVSAARSRPEELDAAIPTANNSSMPPSVAPPLSMLSLTRSKSRGSQHRAAAAAREARVPRESLSDFADFIRETGPPRVDAAPPTRPPPSRAASSTTVAPPSSGSIFNAVRSMSTTTTSKPRPSMINASLMSSASTTTTTSPSGVRARPRFEARSAAVDLRDDTADLIEFIRRGPPASSAIKQHRISRNMALYKPTTDYDPQSGVVGGGSGGGSESAPNHNARNSGTSTNITESSMGSGAALINKNAAAGMPDMMPPGGGMPKRKTRRVRDPYAIDLTDEEEEMEAMLTGKAVPPPPKEESLIDFLNSVPPPSSHNNNNNNSRPVPFATAPPPRAPSKPPVSKPSFMSRFTRHNSISRKTASSHGASNTESRSISSRAGSVFSSHHHNQQPSQQSYPTSSMPPAVEPSSSSSFGTSISISAAHSKQRGPTAAVPVGRTPMMKKYEPREAKSGSSRATQDMADFFRNSGPPQSQRG